jgi:hypothetical protein
VEIEGHEGLNIEAQFCEKPGEGFDHFSRNDTESKHARATQEKADAADEFEDGCTEWLFIEEFEDLENKEDGRKKPSAVTIDGIWVRRTPAGERRDGEWNRRE